MRITGKLLTLDLGVVTGFARGRPGDQRPISGAVRLKKSADPIDIAFSNLFAWLFDEFTNDKPQALIKEKMLSLQAFLSMGNGEATPIAHAKYHGIVEGMCRRFAVPWMDIADSTVRKHFIGKGRLGERQLTKDAVVDRCHLLGLMPRDRNDNNQADAIATWDWGCATFGGRIPSELHFFGEQAGGQQDAARQ